MKRLIVCSVLMGAVSAAPKLELLTTVVSVAAPVGGAAPSETDVAINAGDGTLSLVLSVSPGSQWLSVSVGSPYVCSYSSECHLILFGFTPSTLAAGNYTARVTVSDPNAVDSPQVVIVTLQVNGPPAIDRYMAPGTTFEGAYLHVGATCTGTVCPVVATTADGGGWLLVSVYSAGSFGYYESISLAPPASMAPGTYTGSVTIADSPGQVVPVTMRLTTLPIAVPSTNQISLQLAQNGPATTYPFLPYISLTNSGMGTLEVTGVSGSGTGVSAYNYNALAIVTVDPGSLAPGTYTDGMVTIQCNGANCPVQIPVTLEVDPQGPPIVTYQRVQDNATFATTGSPGDVMVVKGTQLSFEAPQTASGTPLPTTLGGASVLVNGVATPLFYSSFGQIAFQARADTYLGTALVQAVRDGQFGNTVSVNMAQYAPGIVVVTDASYNVVDATHPVKAGSTLVFWALGLGPTNPVVADGTASPSSPPALVTAQVAVQFGLEFFYNTTTPSFVGLSPGSVGLYQVIATLPASTPAGTVSASLQLPGGQLSNTVTIAVQ